MKLIKNEKTRLVYFFLICILTWNPSNMFSEPNYDYMFLDGNGNRFVLNTQDKLSLEYIGITPAQSSSGTYSGGPSETKNISKQEFDEFKTLLQEIKWKTDQKTIDRRKGSSNLFFKDKKIIRYCSFPLHDPQSKKIEFALRKFLMNKTPNDSPDPLIGKTFSVSRDESPWNGFTSSFEEEEKGKHIQSKSFPPSEYEELRSPSDIMLEKTSILARSESKREVVVNAFYFSNLERVDVTKLKFGESISIGTIRAKELIPLSWLLAFLIKGQILITYWHTDAEVKIIAKNDTEDSEIFHLSGTHHYYTNQKNTSNFKFAIRLHKQSNEISVFGE